MSTRREQTPAPERDEASAPGQGVPAATTAGQGAYPPGLEPELEGDELEAARRKERRYTWLVRIQLLMLLAIVALVLYFVFTS